MVLQSFDPRLGATCSTHIVRNGQKSHTCCQHSMQTWVFQIALFKGFPNIPHITLPLGHSVDTNEATMDLTPENAPCWHDRYRPREICNMTQRKIARVQTGSPIKGLPLSTPPPSSRLRKKGGVLLMRIMSVFTSLGGLEKIGGFAQTIMMSNIPKVDDP